VPTFFQHPRGDQPSAVIEDLLDWAVEGRQAAINQAVAMLIDLHEHGHESTYLKKLQALPIFELKSHARGGDKGGVRVYLFFRPEGAVVCGAEIKAGDAPGRKLMEAVRWYNDDNQLAKTERTQKG
jgi:hypothetical protein